MESKIRAAVLPRVPYFREQADTLTFVGVRRVLEEDLGLEKYALDPHKRFVKTYLEECLEVANDGPISKSAEGDSAGSKLNGGVQPKGEEKQSKTAGGRILGDIPVIGVMIGNNKAKSKTRETEQSKTDVLSEIKIKESISKRASHLRKNSGNITMAGVRRLLEEDLKLEKFALDNFKKLIKDQVDEIFSSTEISERVTGDGKQTSRKNSHGKASYNSVKEESSGLAESDSEEIEENDTKKKKGNTPRQKAQSPAALKKRKRDEVNNKDSKRKSKMSKTASPANSDKDGDNVSEENSESSAEKPLQKQEVAKASYGKRVEHLKSVIKSCGMSVPPSVYKKVKQAPEGKREATLIKELEEILAKEGLSANPSEKEIKEVKKMKDRAKELEGIDASNIILSSRRRSATSFVPPLKPIAPVKSDDELSDDEDNSGGDDDDDDNDNDDEEVEEEGDGDEEQDNKEEEGEDGHSEED